jgi:hypothetical protein
MATETAKVIPVLIRVDITRPAFFKLHTATYRTKKDGTLDKGTPDKPKSPRFQVTLLLDPSKKEAQANIVSIKAEAARLMDARYGDRASWPKANPATGLGAPIWCFGNGNDLPKVYAGFKDMFYIKCSDTERPLLGSLDGREVRLLSDGWHVCDKEHNPTEEKVNQEICPYAGANCRARVSLWTFDNESKGVNSNIISLQFTSKNTAFGGRPDTKAEDEFTAYGEYAQQQNEAAKDPFA